ncbi:MAG: FAD/NAD(P)-binding protein [Planctomycetota bacterium]
MSETSAHAAADAADTVRPANPYRPVRAALEDVIVETPTIKTFVMKPEKSIPWVTGQFVEVAVPGLGEAPYTPSSNQKDRERLEVTVMKAGLVTGRMHELEKGAELGVRGPLGKGYPLEKFEGKPLLIVGGGVGLAPLRSLIYALLNDNTNAKKRFPRIIVCYGARTPDDLVYRRTYDEWRGIDGFELHVTVDHEAPGWTGNIGVVTTLLDREEVTVDPAQTPAVVCGPPIMMKFGTLKLLEMGFAPGAIYLSMEKNMSCGVGKCGHCRLGPYFACKDGPVFTYAQVRDQRAIWD